MEKLHKNPYTYIIALAALSVLLALNSFRSSPIIEKASAEWSPEATQMANSIAQDIAQYGSGSALVTQGSKMMRESEAAAKGKDLVLCAEFKARYDRPTKQLVSDENCPLL